MWARVIELMLSIWLALSPFIFSYPKEDTFLWTNTYICAACIALFALLSSWPPLKRAHLLTIFVALWLWKLAYETFPDIAPSYHENFTALSLLLLMLAIVPTHSNQPSSAWQEFERKHKHRTL